MEEEEYAGTIWGQRSDGQLFCVVIKVSHKLAREMEAVNLVGYVESKFKTAMDLFRGYKDCSCGIIGYELTEELNEDGDPIEVPIYSPCETHPRENRKQFV